MAVLIVRLRRRPVGFRLDVIAAERLLEMDYFGLGRVAHDAAREG